MNFSLFFFFHVVVEKLFPSQSALVISLCFCVVLRALLFRLVFYSNRAGSFLGAHRPFPVITRFLLPAFSLVDVFPLRVLGAFRRWTRFLPLFR